MTAGQCLWYTFPMTHTDQSTTKFIPIGMRTKVPDDVARTALVINTCSDNDTDEVGDYARWSWTNPTNWRYPHRYHDIEAVSTECLWQGTKVFSIKGNAARPDPLTLGGDWRRGKGKRPIGAYAGPDAPPITSPGAARRAIYIPAYAHQIESWLRDSPKAAAVLRAARVHNGPVYLRDFDTGQGVDRNGPMSHAWLLSIWLNTGSWPL